MVRGYVSMKEDLRYKYKIKRKYFQHSAREVADGAISDLVSAVFDDKQTFFIYYSYQSEADSHALIERLLAEGKRVFLPRVEGKNMVAAEYFGNESGLVQNKYGICEPQGQACEEEIQVCIAPLLAVNSRGYRLGYGGGFYDRYFQAHPETIRAGIGYNLQITDEFKEEHGDEPLDLFICERGITYYERV